MPRGGQYNTTSRQDRECLIAAHQSERDYLAVVETLTISPSAVYSIIARHERARETLRRGLSRAGYDIYVAEDGSKAVPILQEEDIDCMLTDYKMPGMDGMRLANTAQVVRPSVAVIMISAFANVDTAVSAVKQGIFDVFEKPVKLRDVKKAVARA